MAYKVVVNNTTNKVIQVSDLIKALRNVNVSFIIM